MTAKSSIFNSKSVVPSNSHFLIYFIAQHYWFVYIPVEEGQTQISSLFVQQRWFQSITWMFMERYSMTESQSCVFIATRVTLHHKHLNHYCFMVRSIEIDAAHTHNHEAKDLSSEKGSNFCSVVIVTYSKCCLLEVNRLTRVCDTESWKSRVRLGVLHWIVANERNPQAYYSSQKISMTSGNMIWKAFFKTA